MNEPSPQFKERRIPKGFRRGVSILPVLFTVGNLFMGFWAVIKTLQEDYAHAAVLIGISIVLDLLDGRIARLTGTASEFGGELDSLADVISFGVAPALLLYRWAFEMTFPRAGWLVAFLFVTCGALRLARFNVQRNVVDSRYFVGLPIPAGAGQAAAVVYAASLPIHDKTVSVFVLLAVMCLGLLMVSTLRYRSFKSLDLRSRRGPVHVLLIAAGIALVFLYPPGVLLFAATFYTVSGPFMQAVNFMFRRRDGQGAVAAGTVAGPPSTADNPR
jgi:CDP-diacylglycerol--serine O-phosphatidyltransferase